MKILCVLSAFLVFATAIPSSAQSRTDDGGTVNIHMLDYCDPATFNDALGGGACVRDITFGSITFDGFVAEVGAEKSVGAWRFSPRPAKVEETDQLMISNLGGETHTFTRVQKFGGGFIAFLNDATGLHKPAPECATVVNGELIPQPPGPENLFIPAGGSANHSALDTDIVKFQCCIHPWMRTVVHVHHSGGKD